jgi:putative ABC transport system ATP-binding protein
LENVALVLELAALDSQRAGVVMDLLKRVAWEQQTAILVVTHDS